MNRSESRIAPVPKHRIKGRRLRRLFTAFLLLVGFVSVVELVNRQRDPAAGNPISLSSFFEDGFVISSDGDFGRNNVEVRNNSRFGRSLRVRYPEGSASNGFISDGDAPVGGAQLYMPFRSGIRPDSFHLRYYIRFPENFDFVKGGKLPGLYGGEVTGGKRSPDGTDGFSTRYMWRRGGVGEVYAYLATSEGRGTSLGRGAWNFEPETWHLIEQQVVLNEPGENNGRIRVWVDEREVLNKSGLQYRTVDTLAIEGVFFSTFFGGSDPSWATPKDVHVDFAGFEVGSEYLGPGP